ncbi:hypothetical protein E2C01_010267 [Portunus trituberculatus]|uniref:Uncharacterized protein n=1 Tax=Portunus trituberculatus TaxID=210409 RepID=A0A5B7D810_PORTR|nr:hypothetical protein [Portunus trituberculatus]
MMSLGGDMGPNMGTTINKIACATNGRKLNSASHTPFDLHWLSSQQENKLMLNRLRLHLRAITDVSHIYTKCTQ